jgi:hypothetical protein
MIGLSTPRGVLEIKPVPIPQGPIRKGEIEVTFKTSSLFLCAFCEFFSTCWIATTQPETTSYLTTTQDLENWRAHWQFSLSKRSLPQGYLDKVEAFLLNYDDWIYCWNYEVGPEWWRSFGDFLQRWQLPLFWGSGCEHGRFRSGIRSV